MAIQTSRACPEWGGAEPDIIHAIAAKSSLEKVDFSTASAYATFERAIDLVGDGSILLIQGGGHQAGSVLMLVHLPEGSVLLAGDEVVHFDWLAHNDVQRISSNPQRAADIRNRVRTLMRLVPAITVIPGHDLSRIPGDRDDVVLHSPKLLMQDSWPLQALSQGRPTH